MTDISPSSTVDSTCSTITLDTALSELEEWRTNKNSAGGKIPAALWRKIIYLGEKYGAARIRQLFGVNKSQYNSKYDELSASTIVEEPSAEISFQEIKPERSPHPAATERYHMPDLPATNTVVVELFRSDGKLMKIHTTTHRFKELLNAFYQGV